MRHLWKHFERKEQLDQTFQCSHRRRMWILWNKTYQKWNAESPSQKTQLSRVSPPSIFSKILWTFALTRIRSQCSSWEREFECCGFWMQHRRTTHRDGDSSATSTAVYLMLFEFIYVAKHEINKIFEATKSFYWTVIAQSPRSASIVCGRILNWNWFDNA